METFFDKFFGIKATEKITPEEESNQYHGFFFLRGEPELPADPRRCLFGLGIGGHRCQVWSKPFHAQGVAVPERHPRTWLKGITTKI